MNKTNRFALMLQALTELVQEEGMGNSRGRFDPSRDKTLPRLSDVITSLSPLPHGALFLGIAEDGLPVLLNLLDPIPGPLLITGDSACGKTALLQTIAHAIELIHDPSEVEYGIITHNDEDWSDFQDKENNAGIYRTSETTTQEFIYSLATWAHNNRGEKQSVILLIDGLESAIELGSETEQNLRWLFLRGPSRRVWPIVTLNAGRAEKMLEWLGFFRTRLFGRVEDTQKAQFVTGEDIQMNDLISGRQFAMREGNRWLSFWIPTADAATH